MPVSTLEQIQHDTLALSVARALAIANETATAEGIDPTKSLVTIMEEPSATERLWRIHYGPRDYVHRRGGDLIVLIEERTGVVKQLLHGQ
jgi:hypothetical protein